MSVSRYETASLQQYFFLAKKEATRTGLVELETNAIGMGSRWM